MIRQVRIVLIFYLSIMLSIPITASVSAQSAWDVRVNQVSTLETPDAMVLKVYFNFFDTQTGAPILNAEPTNGQVTLLNNNTVSQGVIKKPDTPIYITLVLDSSGSMAAAANTLKQAAKLALNNPPDNSFFSVIQFDESIKLIQDFTQSINVVDNAIDQYKVNYLSTCLYDAAYTAVESLSKAPSGRRAVILFTDGQDTKGGGTACSRHTYQDVISFANQMQVPINTIGLSDSSANINEVELKSMASSTGGFSAISGQANLPQSFGQIMDALKAQWMLQASVYPGQGKTDAILQVSLSDNSSFDAPFSFESSTAYAGPPSPVVAQFSGLLYHLDTSTYDIQLSLSSPDLVSYVKVSIWDTKAGSKVAEYTFNNPVTDNTFSFSTDQLTVGGDYAIHIIAVSRADNTPFPLARDSQGNATTELVHEFTFDPSASSPKVEIQSVAQQGNDLAVNITTTGTGLIGGFSGWLIDENTNTRVKNSDYTLPALATSSGTILIPTGTNKIPDGKYTLVVQVLGKNNQLYSTTNYSSVVYAATRPSIFQNIWGALIASPVFLILIIVIILGVVGYFMFMSMRSKSLTGTPVMQGRLGGQLEGKKGSSALPLADNEPIPTRGQAPAPPSSPVAPPAYQAPSQPMPVQPPAAGLEDKTMYASGAPEGATVIASRPVPSVAHLTVVQSPLDPSSQGQRVALTQFPFVIGRTEGDLVVRDPNVSRRHAQITFDGTNRTYFITDLNSSNGTRLNGVPLVPGQANQLPNGATVNLGPNVVIRIDLA